MTEKILPMIIKTCRACHHCEIHTDHMIKTISAVCANPDTVPIYKKIMNFYENYRFTIPDIPDWCPLEDYEEAS